METEVTLVACHEMEVVVTALRGTRKPAEEREEQNRSETTPRELRKRHRFCFVFLKNRIHWL